jgi:hypothetical protein
LAQTPENLLRSLWPKTGRTSEKRVAVNRTPLRTPCKGPNLSRWSRTVGPWAPTDAWGGHWGGSGAVSKFIGVVLAFFDCGTVRRTYLACSSGPRSTACHVVNPCNPRVRLPRYHTAPTRGLHGEYTTRRPVQSPCAHGAWRPCNPRVPKACNPRVSGSQEIFASPAKS